MTLESLLQIEWQLAKLNIAFFDHMDRREYESMVSLIIPDGVIHFTQGVTHGREQLSAHTKNWPDVTLRHAVTNQQFWDVTENDARGRLLLTVFTGPAQTAGAAVPRNLSEPHVAEAHDRYVRTAEGWRIAERRFVNVLLPAQIP